MTSTKYGCHSNPRKHGYLAKDGVLVKDHSKYGIVAKQKMVWIANTMSRECRYDQQATDAKCIGCTKAKA
jgi:hypothetical protein